MKKSYLGILTSGLALACALGLSACGGSDEGELQLGMKLFGVTKTGLQISNKGGAPIAVPPGLDYVFPELVPVDSDYDITIVARPANTDSCVVVGGKGNTGAVSPRTIAISCVVTTYALGGTVSGLTGGDLIVNNGSHSVKIAQGATTFSMTAPTADSPKFGQVAEGTPYGLTILQQPARGTCTIANPAGTMPAAAVNNIVISCTP
ncbi:MAG: hypothetical protein WKG03_13325 [Telluria sp.]